MSCLSPYVISHFLTLPLHTSSFTLLLSNNLYSLFSLSAPCRLLKVKPEERLTIEGVLAHPWLNCTEALDNVLPSAQMMMDKVSGKLKVPDVALHRCVMATLLFLNELPHPSHC